MWPVNDLDYGKKVLVLNPTAIGIGLGGLAACDGVRRVNALRSTRHSKRLCGMTIGRIT